MNNNVIRKSLDKLFSGESQISSPRESIIHIQLNLRLNQEIIRWRIDKKEQFIDSRGRKIGIIVEIPKE